VRMFRGINNERFSLAVEIKISLSGSHSSTQTNLVPLLGPRDELALLGPVLFRVCERARVFFVLLLEVCLMSACEIISLLSVIAAMRRRRMKAAKKKETMIQLIA
jgi:hypothetical protein